MCGMSLKVAGEKPPSENAFLGLRLHLIAWIPLSYQGPWFTCRKLVGSYEVCPVNQKRTGMAAALGRPKKLCASSSPATAQAATATAQGHILRKIHSSPPQMSAASGVPTNFQIHTCVRGNHQLPVQISAHTHTHTGASPSLGIFTFFVAFLRSVFMLYPIPSSQTDVYQTFPVKLSLPLTED